MCRLQHATIGIKCFAQVNLFVLNFSEPLAVAMYCGDGAAARRRNRRLRQFLKHEELRLPLLFTTVFSVEHVLTPRPRLISTPPRLAPRPLPLFL